MVTGPAAGTTIRKGIAAATSPPPELRVFGATFDGPHEMQRTAGTVRFEAWAKLDGIATPEVLQLVAHRGLRVGYRLHMGSSDSAVIQAGHAVVAAMDDAALRCRFVLSTAAFGAQPLRLLHVGFLYEGVGRFEDWGRPGGWLAVGSSPADPFKHYFETFNADRP